MKFRERERSMEELARDRSGELIQFKSRAEEIRKSARACTRSRPGMANQIQRWLYATLELVRCVAPCSSITLHLH